MPKTDIKKLPKSQVQVTVTLTDDEFQNYYKPVYNEAASEVTIKGFRKGNAPKDMVAGAIDTEKVFKQAINEAARGTLDELQKENEWQLVDQPAIEVTDIKDGVTYIATLTLFPEVELGNYKKIIKKHFNEPIETEVSDEEKKKTLDWLVNSRAIVNRVAREAKNGDLLEATIKATHDGKEIPNAQLEGDRFILGESKFMPGFDENLVGKKEGEEVTFSITAPKDYWNKDLQEKQIDFSVTVNGVFERTLPELNDEFASSLGPSFKTVDDLKKNIADGLKMEKEQKELQNRQVKTISDIVDQAKIDTPDVLVERMLVQLVEDMKRMIPAEKKKDPAKLDSELREQMKEQAEKNVAAHLVIYKIAKEENLVPSEEDIRAEAALLSVDAEQNAAALYDRIQNRKVFEFLLSHREDNKQEKTDDKQD